MMYPGREYTYIPSFETPTIPTSVFAAVSVGEMFDRVVVEVRLYDRDTGGPQIVNRYIRVQPMNPASMLNGNSTAGHQPPRPRAAGDEGLRIGEETTAALFPRADGSVPDVGRTE